MFKVPRQSAFIRHINSTYILSPHNLPLRNLTMLRSLSKLPISKAARHDACAREKIGLIRGYLSKDQRDILQRKQLNVERDIKLEKRNKLLVLQSPTERAPDKSSWTSCKRRPLTKVFEVQLWS